MRKTLCSSYVLIRNKSYINVVSAENDTSYPKYCKKDSLEKLIQVIIECCFQTSKLDPNGKGHAMPRVKISSVT